MSVDKRFEQVDKRFERLEERMENGFTSLHLEIKHIWNKLEEIEEKVDRIFKMSKEDTDAITNDVFNLRQRVEFLENQIKKFQTA